MIFVSCGQVVPAEIQLGKDLVRLIEQDRRYDAYFAENQSSFDGVTQNILARLDGAAGFIAVLHPRGEVHVPNDGDAPSGSFTRSSVWIEQEIAILAMLSQVQKRPVAVQVYSKRGVVREGLRAYVMANPYVFDNETEVLQHFAGVLASWKLAQPIRGVALRPIISRKQHGLNRELSTLRVAFHNSGDEKATDARVRMRIPSKFIRNNVVENEKRRNSHVEIELDNGYFRDQDLFEQLYPNDTTRNVQEIHYYVDAFRPPSAEDRFEVEIRSGNAALFDGKVPVAELQEMTPNTRYLMMPVIEGVSELVPIGGA